MAGLWPGVRQLLLCAIVAVLSVVVESEVDASVGVDAVDAGTTILEFAKEWFMGGTAVPSHNSLVLSPGVTPRVGMLWKLKPVETSKFQMNMAIKVTKPSDSAKDEIFAVWLVHQNVTKVMDPFFRDHIQNQDKMIAGTWGAVMTEQKFVLAGYKRNYNGLGVFFKVSPEGNSISVVSNDGSKDVGPFPVADAYKFDFTNGATTTLKLDHTDASSIKIEIEHGGVSQGTRTIGAILAGAYVGMSSGSVPADVDPKDAKGKSCKIELEKLDIVNKDETKTIEDVHAVPQTVPRDLEKIAEETVDVLHDSSAQKDHRGESEAIKALTNMVFKLVVETQPMRAQMSRAIDSLGNRITSMEKNFAELQEEIDKKSGHKLNEEFASIKEELSSLSSLTVKSSYKKQKTLEIVHGDIADVHRVVHSADGIDKHLDKLMQANNQVFDKVKGEHNMMFGGSIAALAFIIVAGATLYNKFRSWEKKHSL